MKGLKFLAACAAVGAVSVACAVSSLAATDTTYKLKVSEYNEGTGTIDITVPAEYTALVNGDYTLLVLSDDATSITEANKNIVMQIQQGGDTILTGVKVGTITPIEEDQTFYVRVGGADATDDNTTGYAAGTFTVPGTGSVSPYTNPDRKLGDVDNNNRVNLGDASAIIKYINLDEDIYIKDVDSASASDVDQNNRVNLGDASAIIKYINLDEETYIDGVKKLEDRSTPCERY